MAEKELIDLSLDPKSVASVNAFQQALAKTVEPLQKLVDLSKKLSDLQKALNAKGAAQNLPGYLAGAEGNANRRAGRVIAAGSGLGPELADAKELARLASDKNKSAKELLLNAAAMKLQLEKTIALTKQEVDLDKLKAQLKIADRRRGLELNAGDEKRLQLAQRLVVETEDRIGVLTRELKVTKEIATVAAKTLADQQRIERRAEVVAARQARILAQTPQAALDNPQAYATGVRNAANNRASFFVNSGTGIGEELENAGALSRLADLRGRQAKQLLATTEATRIQIDQTLASVAKETDVAKLKLQLKSAEQRYNLELAGQDRARIAAAERLRSEIQGRITALQQEAKTAKDVAREEAKRLAAERATPKAIAERGRVLTRERLFGDGGVGLLGVQAGLSANYLLLNSIRTSVVDSVAFAANLDSSLRQLQSVVVITDSGLDGLKTKLIELGQSTKFSAVELSDAALILGQAGLSLDQIEKSIGSVARLATASGTDLKQAVDVATSVLGVFELEAGQMANVSNVLTEALNRSKLDIEKLALGLQYSGNTAADAGVHFEELTAALGAMSNAGIRSGSTLGTGMRQILISLEKPSKGFRETLDRLGLTMSDIDVRTNGLYGAMTNLADAGFTASDAIKSFEVRGAAAYTALSRNLDLMLSMESSFYGTNAAITANNTQMRSLENQAKRFGNSLSALIAEGLQPLLFLTRDVFSGLSSGIQVLTGSTAAVQILTTGLVALGAGILVAAGLPLVMGLVSAAAGALSVSITALSGAAIGGSLALGPLALAFAPVVVALGVAGAAWYAFSSEQSLALDEVARAQAQLEISTGEVEAYGAQIETVGNKIQELTDRSALLSSDSRQLEVVTKSVKSQFAAMGLETENVVGTVEGLIAALTELRSNLTEEYVIKLGVQRDDTEALVVGKRGQKDEALSQLRELTTRRPRGGVFDPRRASISQLVGPEGADLSTDQLSTVQRKITTQIGELQSKRAANGGLEGLDRNYLEYITRVSERLNAALGFSTDLDIELEKLAANDRETATAVSPNAEVYKRSEATLLRLSAEVTSRTAAIRKQFRGDATGQADALAALDKSINTQLEYVSFDLNYAVAAGEITEQSLADLDQLAAAIAVNSATNTAGADENAGPVREARQKDLVARIEAARGKLITQLGKPNSVAQITALTGALEQNEIALVAALESSAALGASGGELEAAKIALTAEAEGRKTETDRAVNDARRGAVVSGLQGRVEYLKGSLIQTLENYKTAMADFRQKVIEAEEFEANLLDREGAERYGNFLQQRQRQQKQERNVAAQQGLAGRSRAEGATNTADAEKELATLRKQADLQKLINKYGADSAQVAKARAAAEREVEVALFRSLDVSEDLKRQLIAAYDSLKAAEGATWAWASAMGGVAAQINGIARALANMGGGLIANASRNVEIEALRSGKTAAEAARAVQEDTINREADAAADGAGTGAERFLINFNRRTALYGIQQDVDLEALRAAAPTPGGGGGGGGGGADDGFDTFLESLDSNLEGSAAGQTGEAQAARFKQILDTANAELKVRTAQIEALQGKDLSVAQQKELNRLVDEQGKLLQFIEDAETRIRDVQIEQGTYKVNLNKLLDDFVKKNLDVTSTLEGGVSSVLSTWQGAFGDLFTQLSEAPEEAGESLKQFAITGIKALQGLLAEMLAVYALKSLLGALGGSVGGTGIVSQLLTGLVGKRDGGMVGMAGGGLVPGVLARDSVPVMLMPDEYVLRSTAVQAIGVENLDALNQMGNRKMASGGIVGAAKAGGGFGQPLNIWMAPPDQRPIPGPNDIIAIVSDDMARGGATKQLIKSIQRGM